jgi:hypothetical protein
MKKLIIMAVLGLLLIGSGIWLLYSSAPVVYIPEGSPVITMYNVHRTIGQGDTILAIYEEGAIVYLEDKGPFGRVWRTGKLGEEELGNLLDFFRESGFGELERVYQFPGASVPGATKMGGMSCSFTLNYGGLLKTVDANWYLSPDGGQTYPDMPYPLNEIYKKLKKIADNYTEEVYRESTKTSLLWEQYVFT